MVKTLTHEQLVERCELQGEIIDAILFYIMDKEQPVNYGKYCEFAELLDSLDSIRALHEDENE